jgi:hypothetical protein
MRAINRDSRPQLAGLDRDEFLDEFLALDSAAPSEEYRFVAQLLTPSRTHRRRATSTPAATAQRRRVFLSYASEDRDRVKRLYRRLKHDGHRPWLDVVDLLPGVEWKPAIVAALRSAEIAIVCLSSRSIAKTGTVQEEIRQVLELLRQRPFGKVGVIPARLEACDVPEPLRAYQWVDLFRRGGYTRLAQTLRQAE